MVNHLQIFEGKRFPIQKSLNRQSSMRVKIKSPPKQFPHTLIRLQSRSRENQTKEINQMEDMGYRKREFSRSERNSQNVSQGKYQRDSYAAGLKRKQSRLKQEGQLQKGCLQEQMELISLSDRSVHVENCTEKHFMKLLQGTERLHQRKISK